MNPRTLAAIMIATAGLSLGACGAEPDVSGESSDVTATEARQLVVPVKGEVTSLATDQDTKYSHSSEHVYYVVDGTRIMRAPKVTDKPGAGVETLVTDKDITALAVQDLYIYWATSDGKSDSGSIKRQKIEGGEVETIASGQADPQSLVIIHWANDLTPKEETPSIRVHTAVYWSNHADGTVGYVNIRDRDAGTVGEAQLVDAPEPLGGTVGSIGADAWDDNVYWLHFSDTFKNGAALRGKKLGDLLEELRTTELQMKVGRNATLTRRDNKIYLLDPDAGKLYVLDTHDHTLALTPNTFDLNASAIAADQKSLYYADDAGIHKMRRMQTLEDQDARE